MDTTYFTAQTPESVRELLKQLNRSVSVGFPLSEEAEFVRTRNYQTTQTLKQSLPALAIAYSLLGLLLFFFVTDRSVSNGITGYLIFSINLVPLALLSYHAQARSQVQLTLAILVHLNIVMFALYGFIGPNAMQPYFHFLAALILAMAYTSQILLFRFAFMACLSTGVIIIGFCEIKQIEYDRLFFYLAFLFSNAAGMAIHYHTEKQLRRSFISEKINAITLQLLTQEKTELEKKSLTNKITLLPNHTAIKERLEADIQHCKHLSKPLALLAISVKELDEYKHFYGSHQLESALKKIADLLRLTCSRPIDYVGHYEQHDFICILPETDAQGAQIVSDRIQNNYHKSPILFQDRPQNPVLELTIEIKIANGQDDSAKTVLKALLPHNS